MGQRLELQALLKTMASHVYFQTPPNVAMEYPCIRYKLDDVRTDHADDKPYSHRKRYQVTVIDPNPDSTIPDLVGALPTCAFDRFYTADNLNHFVYKLFF